MESIGEGKQTRNQVLSDSNYQGSAKARKKK
jgi:hypothetical protein